jgi:hypothetical protein
VDILTREEVGSNVDFPIAEASIFPYENSLQSVKLVPILPDKFAIFDQRTSALALDLDSLALFSILKSFNGPCWLTLVMMCHRRRTYREESTALSTS